MSRLRIYDDNQHDKPVAVHTVHADIAAVLP